MSASKQASEKLATVAFLAGLGVALGYAATTFKVVMWILIAAVSLLGLAVVAGIVVVGAVAWVCAAADVKREEQGYNEAIDG